MLSKLWNTSRSGDRRRAFDRQLLKRFREDTRGGVLVYVGIMLPVVLGVTGLALDGSLWYAQKRSVQAIADTAAYAVILEMQRTGIETLAEIFAKNDAVTHGLDESAGDSITFNFPPNYGDYAGMAGYYEVIVERPAPVFLASLLVGDFNTAARAVSGGANATVPPCLLATEPKLKNAFKVNGGTVNTTGCEIQVNSSHNKSALSVSSGGVIEADPINIVGDYDNKGYISSTPNVDMPVVPDPLAGLATPSTSGGCDYENFEVVDGIHILSPGIYCGGIDVSGNAQVAMQPGNYVIMDGTKPDGTVNPGIFSVSGSTGSVTGDSVSVYFDGNSALSVNGNGVMGLSAPTSGTYTGILFHGDPNASTDTSHNITGGGNTILDGIMYFPNAIAKVNGNGNTTSNSDISAIMARELRFGGNGTLNFHINDGAVLPPALQSKLTLVE